MKKERTMKVDVKKLQGILTEDKEFNREIRYFDGTVKMVMGDATYCLLIKDGKLVTITDDLPADTTADTEFGGSDFQWSNLLAPVPVPFYQCIQTSCVREGMTMSNDVKSLAYLPAWNRLIRVMRLNDVKELTI